MRSQTVQAAVSRKDRATSAIELPAYPTYRAIRADWPDPIPPHWRILKLKYLATFSPSASEQRKAPSDLPVSFLPMEALGERGELDLTQVKTLSEIGSGYSYFRDGDVLIAKITPCFENGKGAVAEGLENGIGFGTTELHVLRPAAGVNPRFLYYVSVSRSVRAFGTAVMEGAGGQKRVPAPLLADFEHPAPELDEQHAIVSFLDCETTEIDALIERKERLIELLEEERAALITRAVTRGLGPSVPMRDSGVEWLGEIPAHWSTRQGRYLYRALSLPPKEDDGVVTAYRDGQVTLREKRRAEGYTFAIQEVGYQRVRAGDLVIQGMDAFAGAIGVSDSTGKCSPEYLVLDPLSPGTDNRYYAAALRLMAKRGYIFVVCNAVRERAPRFRIPEFRNVLLPQPPEPEQRAIADFLDRETPKLTRLVSKIHEAIDRLREYRAALISAAVTGKIDVRGKAA